MADILKEIELMINAIKNRPIKNKEDERYNNRPRGAHP